MRCVQRRTGVAIIHIRMRYTAPTPYAPLYRFANLRLDLFPASFHALQKFSSPLVSSKSIQYAYLYPRPQLERRRTFIPPACHDLYQSTLETAQAQPQDLRTSLEYETVDLRGSKMAIVCPGSVWHHSTSSA
jgi:hypothetical protein